jgi:hypothetical protein
MPYGDGIEPLTMTPATRVGLTVLTVCCLVAAAICLVVGVLTLVLFRGVHGLGFLTIPGAVVFLAGLGHSWLSRPLRRDPRWRDFARRLQWLVLIGIGLSVTGFPALLLGAPVDPSPGCPYPLKPGRYTPTIVCQSERNYQLADGSQERFTLGVLVCFYGVFGRNAFNSLRNNRVERATPA